MNGSKRTLIRRIAIRGLIAMAVVIFVLTGWGIQSFPERKPVSMQAGVAVPVLSKNNLPAAVKQDLSAPAVVRLNRADLETDGKVQASGAGTVPSVQQETAAAAVQKVNKKAGQKTVYLTFDDGPSNVTPAVLEILRKQDVKATFFVLGQQAKSHPELINAIWEQGHVIGNHTYNHNYHELYSGFTEFWRQIKQTEEVVREITGIRPQLVRAPGGTYGHFDATYFELLKEAGYTVMDWTVDSGDSKRKGVPAAEILQESVSLKGSRIILLLHDGAGHGESAKALPDIIARYKAAGYSFGVLDAAQEPVQFRVSATAAAAGRTRPSAAWIASNIVPNEGLFGPGKPLMLEVGKLEVKLDPGEFRISNGQYIVPLRAVIERLGGRVGWDTVSRSGSVYWNGREVNADAANKRLTLTSGDGTLITRNSDIELIGSSLWLPLRDLLEEAGHPLLEVRVTEEERRVKAL
ncbi:polysaccharide deacetylase [Paenibacillus typhae]|uniref:Peptidoglycan/xylan/chitin deacetylase, PgdA/CDA1 family n=1 Tax=Paenibacillus typhae TaxID=1174501 RepID=A0A1G8SZT3_9BACL|nr:polysaccharide deacetylase [Paenibacillus typhae]SDJ34070.1 Peptidoglycan/xylan/chitin deacetylase, PgdA/CDA1 family [Paenibacillus typhae]